MRGRTDAGDPRTIEEGTVVGAGAVVTRDLPADVVAVDTAARVVRRLAEPGR
jgi:acetyltransferase-like isoleucine patch superfamily enzyme